MPSSSQVRVVPGGDVLRSSAQTLVNTVNCVGVMGKGVALAFKRRYPDMYQDYVKRCQRGEVRLGQPYVFRSEGRLILNFPTKDHWRSVSRLEDIVAGLEYLKLNYRDWGIESLACPPLGCGNGQLEWEVVGPTLYRHLSELDIPVELFAPRGVSPQLELPLATDAPVGPRFVEPEWFALTALISQLERQPYHWPVGRVFLQKIAYFASAAGLPTGLSWTRGSYGPYTPTLKSVVARLQNNGLLDETSQGNMIRVTVGPTYLDALETYRPLIKEWSEPLRRTLDLASRLDTHRAEVAATVHFVATELTQEFGRQPYAHEVVEAVEEWKVRRRPPIQRADILEAVVTLASQKWIAVHADSMLREALDEEVTV